MSTFFFLFDFYHMKGSSDDEDRLPEAIVYFYPTDAHIKKQKLLDCGEIVGLVQFFKHDLFASIPRTLNFNRTIVAHEHYGRNSGFLCLSSDRFTPEETHVHLQRILVLFNMLYGTWNNIHALYPSIAAMHEFLNRALTPIVNSVFTQDRSIPSMFSTIDYVPFKRDSQRVLLESKHCLDYLKSKHGLLAGLIGYDNKLLYSSLDTETTFYLQSILRIERELPSDLIYVPWQSKEKLKDGISLIRVYLRQSLNLAPILKKVTNNVVSPSPSMSMSPTMFHEISRSIDIVDTLSSGFDESLSLVTDLSSVNTSMSSSGGSRRHGLLMPDDRSGSPEDAEFDTDALDDLSSPNVTDTSSTSSSVDSAERFMKQSSNDDSDLPPCATWHHESLTDDEKQELKMRTRASTLESVDNDEREQTLTELTSKSIDDSFVEIRFHEVLTADNNENPLENLANPSSLQEPIFRRRRTSSGTGRKSTITKNSPTGTSHGINHGHDLRVSWTDIPDINIEHERDEFVLYVQRNSHMMFAGVIEPSVLSDEYLKTLWRFMLHQFADMETDIQVIPPAYDSMKSNADVKFTFNENTRLVDFERSFDGNRNNRQLPSEECAYIAFTARSELNRNSERKAIGLSRGDNLISAERRLPDRATYLCRRVYDKF